MPVSVVNVHNYHYFYKITNLVNNKFYYGIRSCDCDPEEDPYMGSGKILHRAYEKYGIENFEKLVLKVLPTREDASDLERWIVDLEMVKNPNCYNVSLGGDISRGTAISEGLVVVYDTLANERKLVSLDEFYSEDNVRYVSIMKDTFSVYDKVIDSSHRISKDDFYKDQDRYIINLLVDSNGFLKVIDSDGNEFKVKYNDPRFLSGELRRAPKRRLLSDEENSRRISEGKKKYYKESGAKSPEYGVRRTYVNNGVIHKKVKDEEVDSYLSTGEWKLGRLESELSSKVHSEMLKATKGTYRNMTNGEINKRVPIDEIPKYESNGWWISMTRHNPRRKNSVPSSKLGKVRINNGIENKMVFPDELDYWYSQGYKKGTIFKNDQPRKSSSRKGKVVAMNNGEISKQVLKSEYELYLANGWKDGYLPKKSGKIRYVNNGIENKGVPIDELDNYLSNGWNLGRMTSDSEKDKVLMNDGTKNFYVKKWEVDEYIKNGYLKGSCKSGGCLGLITVNNGETSTRIKPEELDYYLSLGYVRGLLKNKNNQR